MGTSEKIWYQDPTDFITSKNFLQFFPDNNMTFSEQLNALLRFSIYFSVIVFLFRQNVNIAIFPLFMAGFTFFLYKFDKNTNIKDKFSQSSGKEDYMYDVRKGNLCVAPSKNNPFMNVLMTDYVDRPERPVACDLTENVVKKKARDHFNFNLYRDVDDIFSKKASDRQFYTTPITTIPNDSHSFAEWCYGSGKTCKEGNSTKCFSNLYQRPIKN